jgi:hypothetical protein
MSDPINFLIKNFAKFNVNMLKQVSDTSCAVQVKYSFPYSQFNMDSSFQILNITKPFEYNPEYHQKKVEGYKFQDDKAKRDSKNNTTEKDYKAMKDMFKNGVCYICNQHFGIRSDGIHITPTLDRQDNKLEHSLNYCKPCCKRCNCLKSDSDDFEMIKLKVQ